MSNLMSIQAGVLSLWLSLSGTSVPLSDVGLSALWSMPQFAVDSTDPDATALVQNYLRDLAAQGGNPQNQGIWIQAGNQVLVNYGGTIPRSAASLTKVATSLAAIVTWGVDHQFETLVGATGPLSNGVLQGDLVIKGGGDPFFVWEEAIVLGNTLNRLGIRQVTGNLIILDQFYMNYETDPKLSGELLRQAINVELWSTEVEDQYANLPLNTPKPQVLIQGQIQLGQTPSGNPKNLNSANLTNPYREAVPLVKHYSLPLSQVLKLMNVYSNNPMAEILANQLGGAKQVAKISAAAAKVPVSEVQLVNGSGLGVANRISPRSAAAMLVALQIRLQTQSSQVTDSFLTLTDLLPEAGIEFGTLIDRRLPAHTVVKTGTLNQVSALSGTLPTKDQGLVWFAIINGGTNIEAFRVEQDRLLQRLSNQFGPMPTAPTTLARQTRSEHDRIGDETRNEILLQQ